MDKNLKNSLFFGAAVGGLFALVRHAGDKQKLSEGQLKSVNELNEAFAKLCNSIIENLSLAPILASVKEFESKKQYKEIIARIEKDIQKDAENLGLVKSFRSKLQYVLSGRFTEQKNNARSHESQSFFLQLKELPDMLTSILEKRTQIFRLMQKAFGYIDAGEATDFKPDDAVLIKTYVSEFNALEKQVEGLLGELKPYRQ